MTARRDEKTPEPGVFSDDALKSAATGLTDTLLSVISRLYPPSPAALYDSPALRQ
ncbi:hypothetical protein GCM10009414_21510 [Tatumella terrea]